LAINDHGTGECRCSQACLSFSRYNLQMIPLLDSESRIKRVVTKEEIGAEFRARAQAEV